MLQANSCYEITYLCFKEKIKYKLYCNAESLRHNVKEALVVNTLIALSTALLER
jgi:hypothetical protein